MDLGVAGATTDEIYTAMDWLVSRQRRIEAGLAARHLRAGGIAMFDLSSSWVEGTQCELAAFGERVGKVIGKHKVGKHFIRDITDTSFTYKRDEEKNAAEAAFDGIYVIRTSVPASTLDSAGTVTAYKNLKYVERDFRITKTDDLDLRPIYHYLENRVRAHVLICMLAAYLTWHLRQALAELTYTDQDILTAPDPIAPAQRSAQAKTKDATKRNTDNLPIHKYQDLLNHLATLDRQTTLFAGQKIEKLTTPTPLQHRAFELLGAPVPLTLQ